MKRVNSLSSREERMISLSNILKHNGQDLTVKSYEYCLDFSNEKDSVSYESDEMSQVMNETSFEDTVDEIKNIDPDMSLNEMRLKGLEIDRSDILYEARKEADELYRLAKIDVQELKQNAIEEGKQQGYDEGYKMGYEKAYADNKEKMNEKCRLYLSELEGIVNAAELKKEEVIDRYLDDLKNISLAVAEKVVHISLQTSGEVIKKMILTATEKLKTKEWAKIYIAKCDASLLVEGNKDILEAISHLSKNIKVIIMENENPGTCIIELPDQIIDASSSTQIENIKGILNNAGTYGGNTIV